MRKERGPASPRNMATGARIYARRKEKGVTQTQLANAIGVGTGIISMWERGTRGLSAENLEKLAAYLDVSPGYLADGDGAPDTAPVVDAPEPPQTVPVEIDSATYERIRRAAEAEGTDVAAYIAAAVERPLELFEVQQRHATPNDAFETYTVEEVATLLDITVRTVQQLIHSGALAARKIGKRWRITPDNLKAYINGQQ